MRGVSWLKGATSALVFVIGAGVGNAQADEIYYQAGFTDDLVVFDTDTATESFVGNMGIADSWGFSFSSSGVLFGHNRSTQSLYSIDTTTAAVTLIGATGIEAEDLTFGPPGSSLFASDLDTLYEIDPVTAGILTTTPLSTTLDGLTLTPTAQTVSGIGSVAAGTLFGVDSGSLYIVDPGSGLTLVGSVGAASETIAFGSDGTLYTHNSASEFFTVDLATLSATSIGTTTDSLVFASAVAPDIQSVPVPGTLILLSFGLVLFAVGGVARAFAWVDPNTGCNVNLARAVT